MNKFRELKEPCKSAIAENRCLGCIGLGEKDWKEPVKCKYLEEEKKYNKDWRINNERR